MPVVRTDDIYLDAVLRGWIVNTAKKELWRMSDWYSLEDLVQDGYLCYCKCRERYKKDKQLWSVAPTKMQRRWFMALVQTAYYNHIMTLATKASRTPEDSSVRLVDLLDTLVGTPVAVAEEASITAALAKLPAELMDALEKLTNDAFDEGVYLRRKLSSNKVNSVRAVIRETTNEHWERVLGQADVRERLTSFLPL